MHRSLTVLSIIFLSGLLVLGFSQYSNKIESSAKLSLKTESQIDSLLRLMTLEEKVGQMIQYSGYAELTGPGAKEGGTLEKHNKIKNGLVGSMLNVLSVASTREAQELAVKNSRLGIPMLFGYDVIHGYKTIFPIPLGEAASWDLKAIQSSASIAAKEAAAAGVHWTFAPMVDIYRDARWGRVMEGAGEDPYLGSRIAASRVKGFQGDDLSATTTVAACAKHFAAYGFAEAGRDYNTVDISDHTLHNVILPPFKACADAGVATFMNAFNEIGGVPATGHQYLQRELLKGEWGFEGFIVSDWGSIAEMIDHGIARDTLHASELAALAGCDMDMEGYCYEQYLAYHVKQGNIKETLIDNAVRRILRLKFQLGLFDDPYRYCNEDRERRVLSSKENQKVARDVAKRSIVLLKNANQLLPLPKDLSSIAVIGPLANDKDAPLGNWRAQAVPGSAVSLLEGIRAAAPKGTVVNYAEGCKLSIGPRTFDQELVLNKSDRSQIREAVKLAKSSDRVVLAIGEDALQSGEGRSQVDIGLHGVQQELVDAVYAANPNVVVVLMSGRPMVITPVAEKVPAILAAWHLGSEAGNAIADVLFGAYNPAGKLPMSFPRHVGQCPIYYNQKNTGRPGPKQEVFWSHYTDERNDPLWPFGYGLSYTTFEYKNMKASQTAIEMGETLEVSVEVTNTGKYDGEEVVQLYIADLVGSVTRPKRELKGFEKVFIRKGKTRRVRFQIETKDLAFYTRRKRWEAEPGQFKVFLGTDSNAALALEFELKPLETK